MASIYDLNVSYRKTFVNFEILWLFEKVFFAKFGGIVFVGGPSE